MTVSLQREFGELAQLPEEEQDRWAEWIRSQRDDALWEASFAKSSALLDALSERAMAQVRAGECREAGFDEL